MPVDEIAENGIAKLNDQLLLVATSIFEEQWSESCQALADMANEAQALRRALGEKHGVPLDPTDTGS